MIPRRTHARHTPPRTNGDEAVAVPCADNLWPFDALLEHKPGTRHYRTARAVAREVCQGCELRRTCDFSLAKRGA